MGGHVSTTAPAIESSCSQSSPRASEKAIISLMMPLFYTQAALEAAELQEAARIWKLITMNQSKRFNELKASDPDMQVKLAGDYLHVVFYKRLFDVHPSCRNLFNRAVNKMNIIPMISLVLSKINDEQGLKNTLCNLVNVHNKIGVKAVEYGIVGEVLMFAIKETVGAAEYSALGHSGWCKIYSRILDIIIPAVMDYELSHRETSQRLVQKRRADSFNSTNTLTTKSTQATKDPMTAVVP